MNASLTSRQARQAVEQRPPAPASAVRLSTGPDADRPEQTRWRIVRYIEEPQELADLNRWWRHPAAGKPELIRYAVEVDGERKVWGLATRDAALRWLARLTAPVQLEVPELEAIG